MPIPSWLMAIREAHSRKRGLRGHTLQEEGWGWARAHRGFKLEIHQIEPFGRRPTYDVHYFFYLFIATIRTKPVSEQSWTVL